MKRSIWLILGDFFDPQYPTHVCRCKKPICGLKQAPRAWFGKLNSALSNMGFVASKTDPSMFIKSSPTSHVFIVVDVDDIMVTGSDSKEVEVVIGQLSSVFSLKDLGLFDYFLGI